jgi:uncharacterized protein YceK
MKKLLALAIAVAVIGGCVTVKMEEPKPGQYANYRDMMYSKMRAFHWKDVPQRLETKMVTCTVDIIVNSLTPEEAARLDAYARAEITMSDSEKAALDRRMRNRLDDATFGREMEKTCPETAAELADFRAKNG